MQLETQSLTPRDLVELEKCYITPELARQAGLFRVESPQGADLVGRSDCGNYSGVIYPNFWPGDDKPREYRLRRDDPDIKRQADGSIKEKCKYLSPPGRGNQVYFPRQVDPESLSDANVPIVVTEGEKKALALWRLAHHEVASESPRFISLGLSGVWNWHGVVEKTADKKGKRRSLKGVIADFDRIVWEGRLVYISFDVNVRTNESVNHARNALARELERRGADVRLVDLPELSGVNGVDDLLGVKGPDFVLRLIAGASSLKAGAERESPTTKLLELANEVRLFHTPDGEPYANFQVGKHIESWPLKSRGFRDWLTRRFYETERKAPTAQSLKDALNTLSSRASFDGQACEVHTRIAQFNDALYVDLVDEEWRVVEITAASWATIDAKDSPVRFRRTKGMLALPVPQKGTSIQALRRFLNVIDEQWPLVLGWLVACFRPGRPFPVLALHGEQGSAKSTSARVLRRLVDPNKAALRSDPRDERDLILAATNGWVVALDNVSRIPPWLSDALCRLATGGGFGTRTLYENDEETLFDAKRPVLLNGIEELATRSDLLDRTLVLTLPTIPDHQRKTENALWNEFEIEWPGIFGALLDAVSYALFNESSVHLATLPRMADFAQWAVAAEPALSLNEGDFMRAYTGNRESANDIALESSPAAALIIAFVIERERWEGSASDLLEKLNARASDELKKQYGWPKSAPALGGILKRLSPNLRAMGITIERGAGRHRRIWMLAKSGNSLSRLSPLSPAPLLSGHGDNNDAPRAGSTYDLSPTKSFGSTVGVRGDKRDDRLPRTQNSPLIYELAERAAICEFDGGLEREEAERVASLHARG
jgi:hypothetical protein